MPREDFKTSIEQIRSHNDIVDVIGSYVKLKRGGSAYKGLCPFHKEKTPSFTVNPARQAFHCFGCDAKGDVFSFIMQYENTDFMQAARMLAQRAGLSVELQAGDHRSSGEKEALRTLHLKTTELYHKCLLTAPEAEKARAYLADRKLDGAATETFGIGYAPPGNRLLKWAGQFGVSLEALEKAGLVAKSEDGEYYDRFRDRLMFPIRDEIGQVIGFSGRVLPGDDRNAKYVNSPETLIFRKSRILYAMDRAKKRMLDERTAILCEGQIDVIRCQLEGFEHAVAAQGTAVTDEHARILKRFADTVILLLDADTAGRKAALRSSEVMLAEGLDILVAALPEGEDPDSILLRDGRQGLEAILGQAVPGLEFLIRTQQEDNNDGSQAAKLRTSSAVLDYIALAPSAVLQEEMISRAAALLQTSVEALTEDFRRKQQRGARPTPLSTGPEPSRTRRTMLDAPGDTTSYPRDETEILKLLLHHPGCCDVVAEYLSPNNLVHPVCRRVYEALMRNPGDEEWNIMTELAVDDDEEARLLAADLMMKPDMITGKERTPEHAARDFLKSIHIRNLHRKLSDLNQARQEDEAGGGLGFEQDIQDVLMGIKILQGPWERARMWLEFNVDHEAFR